MQVSLRAVVVPASLVFQLLVARSCASSLSNLRGSTRNSTSTVRRLESCTFDITGTPEKYGNITTVVWSGPCDTTFKTEVEADKWCKENHDLDAVILKTSTGESLDLLSCANQAWEIERRSCSWLPLGSVLQSHHDATAADIEGYNPFPTQFETETGCRELCLNVDACVGYSWRSGGKTHHTHYHRCFLISRVGAGNVMKDEWFTSGLCEKRTPASTAPTPVPTAPTPTGTCTAAPQGNHGLGQVPVCGCNTSVLSEGISFCLNGQTLTVESSWDSVIPLTELGTDGTLGVDMCLGATVVIVSPVSSGWNWKDDIIIGSCKQSCAYDIKAAPAKYGKDTDFQWHGPCGTTFTTVVEHHAWCKANFSLDATMLKTSTGETLGYLSCSNQDWSIEAFSGAQAGRDTTHTTNEAETEAETRELKASVSMTLQVQNAAAFIEDDSARDTVKQSITELLHVPAMYVSATFKVVDQSARRLADLKRRLAQAVEVQVALTIPETADDKTVPALADIRKKVEEVKEEGGKDELQEGIAKKIQDKGLADTYGAPTIAAITSSVTVGATDGTTTTTTVVLPTTSDSDDLEHASSACKRQIEHMLFVFLCYMAL